MKQRSILFIFVHADILSMAFVPIKDGSADILEVAGSCLQMADALKLFAARYARWHPLLVGVLPQRSVLRTTMKIPTQDPAEARAIALLQFVRSTPHKPEEVIVDAAPLTCDHKGAGVFDCALVTHIARKPLYSVLQQAAVVPERVIVIQQEASIEWRQVADDLRCKKDLFDLRDEFERQEDHRRRWSAELKRMAVVVFIAACFWLAADGIGLWTRKVQRDQLEQAWMQIAPQVQVLSGRCERIKDLQQAFERRIDVGRWVRILSEVAPDRIRLRSLSLNEERKIRIQGEAQVVGDVGVFRDALTRGNFCRQVEIEGLEQHRAETGEAMAFTLICSVGS